MTYRAHYRDILVTPRLQPCMHAFRMAPQVAAKLGTRNAAARDRRGEYRELEPLAIMYGTDTKATIV